jgi:2-keto-3-deoxy-6-phosphogluconate aldolase
MLANDAYGLFDIETPFGLIEALGGAEALSKVLPSGGTHIDPVERVLNWARGGCHGFISPGLHLRLLGMAAQVGKTVHPGVFGMSEATIGYDGLIDLARAVDFARHTKRRR